MAVTSGTTSSKTMGGGNKSSGSGGIGQGGQGGGYNSGSSGSKGGGASTQKAGSGTGSKAASPSKTSNNPTGGSLQAPARSAPSKGITSNNSRTAAQQNAMDKAKQAATQYGGAQQSMRQANTTVSKAPSAKVSDPSRSGNLTGVGGPGAGGGFGSDNIRKGSSLTGVGANSGLEASGNVAGGKPDSQHMMDHAQGIVDQRSIAARGPITGAAQDPSIAGRAAQANKNYSVTTGPGGMVSRTYSNPNVSQPNTLGNAVNALHSLFSGPQVSTSLDPSLVGRVQAAQTPLHELGVTANAAWNNAKGLTGSFIDNLMGHPLMGQSTITPSTVANSPASPNAPQYGPGLTVTQPVRADVPAGSTMAQSVKQITDRVPQDLNYQAPNIPAGITNVQPGTALVGNVLNGVPLNANIDRVRQATVQQIQQARAPQVASIPATPQSATPVRQGSVTNPFNRSPSQQIADMRQTIQGQITDPTIASAPTTPTRAPLAGGGQINIPGGGLPTGPGPDVAPSQQLAGPVTPTREPGPFGPGLYSDSLPPGYRDAYLSNPVAPATASPKTSQPVAPSQAGNYPANKNPSQDDGQPQSLRELGNRYSYEKAKAKDGWDHLAGNLYNALVNGDFRPYRGQTNDKREPPVQIVASTSNPLVAQQQTQQASLLAQLMAALQQGSANSSQAALVQSTFG